MDEKKQWNLLKQLIKARYSTMFSAHKEPLFKHRMDMDKAICTALGLDYYETTAEEYQRAISEVLKNEDL